MKSEKIILENIIKSELYKINLHSFHFIKQNQSIVNSTQSTKSASTFYNTKDLHKRDFPKNISLLTPKEHYDKL